MGRGNRWASQCVSISGEEDPKMELQNFKNVQLIIGEPSYEVRIGLKTAFCAAGFEHGHIKDTDKVLAVRDIAS